MAELTAAPSVEWLSMCLYSSFKNLPSTCIFSKLVLSPPSPPPVLPVVHPPPPPPPALLTDPHPIIQTMQKLELGKLMLTVTITATIGLLFSHKFDRAHHIIIVGSMAAFMLLWNGILMKESFPHLGDMLQLLGITLALFFLYGLVATFLSPGFSTACWILGALCLTPFVCVLVRPQAAAT